MHNLEGPHVLVSSALKTTGYALIYEVLKAMLNTNK